MSAQYDVLRSTAEIRRLIAQERHRRERTRFENNARAGSVLITIKLTLLIAMTQRTRLLTPVIPRYLSSHERIKLPGYTRVDTSRDRLLTLVDG